MLHDTQAVNVYYRRYLREKMCFTYPSESILEGNVGNKLPHFGSWSLDRCNLFFVSVFASIHCWCLLSEVYERRGGWGLCVCCLHSDFHLPSLNNLTMMREHTESTAILQSTALCQRGVLEAANFASATLHARRQFWHHAALLHLSLLLVLRAE